MKRSRYMGELIISALKEREAEVPAEAFCRKHGMSEGAFFNRKSRYGGVEVSAARRRLICEGCSR